jgi:hypothetical protein
VPQGVSATDRLEPRSIAAPQNDRRNPAWRVLQIAGVSLLFVVAAARVGLPGNAIVGDPWYVAGVAAMFGAMLLLVHLRPRGRELIVPALAGLGARLMFAPFPVSDDTYRYLWEGYIQRFGFDPFVLPPNAPALSHLRTALWDLINHRHIPTIYWPAAQLLFKAVAAVSDTPMAFKLAFAPFDIGTAALVMYLLRIHGRPVRYAMLYWLNPLILVFTAGEAHLEIMLVFFIVAALVLFRKERWRLMFASLGLAVMTKMTAFMVIPLLITRRNARYAWCLLVPASLFLLYPGGARQALSVPFLFTRDFSYNGVLHTFLGSVVPQALATGLALMCLVAGLAFVFLLTPDKLKAVRNAMALFLLCSPTVHPWYFQLMTPFLPLFPSPAWLTLHLTSLPLVFYFNDIAQGESWHDRGFLLAVEFAPFFIVALLAWLYRTTLFGCRCETGHRPSISVVIPTLNEECRIAECISDVIEQNVGAEIIVADGGSSDATVQRACSFSTARVVQTPKGRGIQIREGIRSSAGEILVVLHADSRLRQGALQRMLRCLQRHPDIAGGAFGARYDDRRLRFRLTAALNNIRVVLTGISYGDQGQFFRRSALGDRVPPYRLMEDVEISFLMKEAGRVAFIPGGLVSSTRHWVRAGYAANFVQIGRAHV